MMRHAQLPDLALAPTSMLSPSLLCPPPTSQERAAQELLSMDYLRVPHQHFLVLCPRSEQQLNEVTFVNSAVL